MESPHRAPSTACSTLLGPTRHSGPLGSRLSPGGNPSRSPPTGPLALRVAPCWGPQDIPDSLSPVCRPDSNDFLRFSFVAKISSGSLQSRRDVWSDPEVAAPHAVAGAGGGAAGGSVRSLAARALHLLQENAPQDLLLLQTFRTLSLGRLMIYPGPVAEPGRCLAAIRCHCQIGAIAAR